MESGRLLRLCAEMRVPGRAWLQFEVDPAPGGATIRQTAMFDPHGLAGVIYWYAMFPLHQFVFRGMLRNITAQPLPFVQTGPAPQGMGDVEGLKSVAGCGTG